MPRQGGGLRQGERERQRLLVFFMQLKGKVLRYSQTRKILYSVICRSTSLRSSSSRIDYTTRQILCDLLKFQHCF